MRLAERKPPSIALGDFHFSARLTPVDHERNLSDRQAIAGVFKSRIEEHGPNIEVAQRRLVRPLIAVAVADRIPVAVSN
jgi:hypothetical protein